MCEHSKQQTEKRWLCAHISRTQMHVRSERHWIEKRRCKGQSTDKGESKHAQMDPDTHLLVFVAEYGMQRIIK
jgi:hypothetical protein